MKHNIGIFYHSVRLRRSLVSSTFSSTGNKKRLPSIFLVSVSCEWA